METFVAGTGAEVVIGPDRPTVLIGERINPSGKKRLADSLRAGDMSVVREEAVAQVSAGAHILDVNVAVTGLDEVELLPRAVLAVSDAVDVPLCLDSRNVAALRAALAVCPGRPIVNSVTAEQSSLAEVLALVKEFDVPVIGLCLDDEGISKEAGRRVLLAHEIVAEAEALGIARHDVILDCLTLSLGADTGAGRAALEAVRQVKEELGVNQTQGVSNISYGLPDRPLLNSTYLVMAVQAGLTCPTVDVAQVRSAAPALDLILGRDDYALRYISAFRSRSGS